MADAEQHAAIEAHHIAYHYGAVAAIDDLSLQVARGEIVAVLGPNGAGKTTAIRVLTTILAPSRGSFKIAGVPHTRPRDLRQRIGVLPESAGFPARQTGREYLRFHARLFGATRAHATAIATRLLTDVDLIDRADDPIGAYSRGMRQRLGIARALVNEPRVMFLDEPTLGLDPRGQAEVLDLIRRLAAERGVTVLLSTHLLAEVEAVCSRVVILSRGRLVIDGTVSDVIASVTATRTARLRVAVADLEAAAAALAAVAGVQVLPSRERATGHLRIVLDSVEPADALRALLERGISITQFELDQASLSDAFLQLTEAPSP